MQKSHFEIELDRILKREPFRAFYVVLSSGERYRVENPSLFIVSETIIHHYVARSDDYNVLRINQLSAIEVVGPLEP